jgi:hypothetical protein
LREKLDGASSFTSSHRRAKDVELFCSLNQDAVISHFVSSAGHTLINLATTVQTFESIRPQLEETTWHPERFLLTFALPRRRARLKTALPPAIMASHSHMW